jgi:hypothetical protein
MFHNERTIKQKIRLMQDKNKADVRNILLAIADHLNVDKIRGLARRLDIQEGTMYAWIKRNKIGNTGAILEKLPYLSLKWLETGEGPMFKDQDGDRYNGPANQTITGKNSIQAGRSIIGGKNTVVMKEADQLPGDAIVLDADELQLILLSREVGGKLMVRKFIVELERLKKDIEARF